MSKSKFVIFFALFLFGSIAALALLRKSRMDAPVDLATSVAIELGEVEVVENHETIEEEPIAHPTTSLTAPLPVDDLPNANRVEELFASRGKKMPIVETITYKSHVPWLKGRPAWLADYASHYSTSRHFIARSLNGAPLYDKQEVSNGDRFNVLRQDEKVQFYLLVDLFTCHLWLYSYEPDQNRRTLIKRYPVGLGRLDPASPSGYLTPLGKYSLGERVAIYHPNQYAFLRGERTEMIQQFGTRWIPFAEEMEGCTHPAKGFGIHGLPWKRAANGELKEDLESLVSYASDGCIRLATEDIEELFAIIITKPSVIEIVKGFHTAQLPGNESFQ